MGKIMKALVAVYSFTGRTLKVAEQLKSELGADLTRLEPQKDVSYMGKCIDAFLRRKAPLKPCQTDLGGYDLLVLCGPVWCYSPPAGVNEYISRLQNANGKKCAVVLTMGSGGDRRTTGMMRKDLEKKGVSFVDSVALIEADVDGGKCGASVSQFAAKLKA
jgi:putative NADPH-quinone reductase